MRINIAASHRFHLLDLARELEKQGHTVRFYSYVPTKRAIKFGLKKECSYSLFFLALPFLAMVKLSKNADWSLKLINQVLDLYMSLFMKPCDFYIAIGYVYKLSFRVAKKRFRAITINEWGSKHNEEQNRILSKIPGLKQQNIYFRKRILNSYLVADYIAIPSDHVKKTFIENGVPVNKLIQNVYGVDLSMFNPTKLIDNNAFDILIVGGWSYVKGCDLLISLLTNSELTLLHVGSIVNLEFPKRKNMVHIDPVDQTKLKEYYSLAKVFVLPSRAEGMAMVQLQALACGLPIVCSKDTGGRDLKKFLADESWIKEMEEFSEKELSRCISEALALAKTQSGLRCYSANTQEFFSWESYGKRYNQNLQRIEIYPAC